MICASFFVSTSFVFAQLSTESNTVTTRVGNPTNVALSGAGEKIANKAREIASQLKKSDAIPSPPGCDVGGTFGASFHCWEPEKMKRYNQAGNPDYLECTEFVWAVFAEADYEDQIKLIKDHNAFEWASYARSSPKAQEVFSIFDDPNQLQPGDIISAGEGWIDGQPWGHVAVVIAKEGNRVAIAQASTAKATENWFIQNGTLVSPFKSAARSPIRGFFRLKTL